MSSKQAGRKAWGGGGKRRVVSRSLTSSRSTSTTSVQKFSSSDTDLDLVDVDDDVDIGLLAELSAELPLTSKTYGGGMQGAAARQRAFRRKKQEEQHARLDAQRKRNSVVPQRTASSVLRKKLASGKTAIGWAAKLKEAHLDRKKRVLSPRQQAARRQEAAAVERNKARPPRSIKLSGNGGGLLYKLIRCTDYHQLFLRLGIDFWSLVALRFDFDRIDADRTLTIDIEEFLQHFQFTFKTPLIQKVFGAFDLNGSRDLDFAEFVVCTWNYGSCSAAELNAYFFDMYDPQHKGVLQEKTLLQMVSDAYGHHNMAKTCQAALERAGFMKQVSRAPGVRGVTMTRTEFVTFAGKNPALFFPMATLQRQVCAKIGPKGFWKKQIKARGKAFQPFRPALWDLQRLFQPKDYLERASLTVHGASDLSLRGSSREPPSVFCKVYCCTVPSKSEASHICWDTVMPQFAKTIDFIGVHLNDRIRVEIWDWPHPRSLVRPAGMCQLLGSVEVRGWLQRVESH